MAKRFSNSVEEGSETTRALSPSVDRKEPKKNGSIVHLQESQGGPPMKEIFAQGDMLIERVPDVVPSGRIAQNTDGAAMVLAEGEATGHRHAIWERVVMFRDDGLARDIPADLYVGHVKIDAPSARVTHDEHAPLTLPRGTYRVRRQRELEPRDARIVAD
jgi:hypothetical protein